jgi:chromosome segregation ATPase
MLMPPNPKQPSRGSSGIADALNDMVDLNEDSMVAQTPSSAEDSLAAHNNQLLESAQVFEQHVEQLTAWKHQLASQMELLRKDGIKLLERQKQLAQERAAVAQEQQGTQAQRAALEADRKQIETLKRDLQTRQQELDQRATDLENATEEFNKLLDQKERYLQEAAEAQKNLESIRTRHEQANHQLEEFAKKAEEMTRLEAEKDRWLGQIHEAKATVDQLVQTQQEMLKHQQDISQRMNDFALREKAVQDRETQSAQQQGLLSSALQEVHKQRAALQESEQKLAQQQKDLQAQIAAHQAAIEQHQRQQKDISVKSQETTALQAQQARLAEEVQSLRARMTELQTQSETSEGASAQLRVDLSALQAQSQDALRQKEQQITALQQQLQAAAAKDAALEAAQTENRELAAQAKSFADQAGWLAAERAALQTQAQELQQQIAASSAAAAELRQHMTEAESAAQHALQQKQQEISALQQQLQTASGKSESLAASQAQCRDLAAQIQALDQQVAELSAVRATMNQQTQELRQQLQTSDAAAAELREHLATLQAAAAASEQTVQQKEAEISSLQTQLQSAATKDQALATAKAQIQDLNEQLAALGQQAADLNAARSALESQTQQLREQLQSQLAAAQADKEETGRLLATHAARTAAVEQQLAEVAEKLTAAATQAGTLEQAKRQQALLTEQLSAANRQSQTLQASRAAMESQIAQLELQLQEQIDSTEVQNRLADQKRRYENLLATKQNQIVELQRLVEVVQSQDPDRATSLLLIESEAQTKELTQQLADAQRDLDQLRSARTGDEQIVADLQARLAGAAQEAAELQQKIDHHKTEHEAAIAELHTSYQAQLEQERAATAAAREQVTPAAPSDADMQAQLETQLAEYKTAFAARLQELQQTYETKIAEERRLANETLAQAQALSAGTQSVNPEHEKALALWEQRVNELQAERDALLGTRVELEEAAAQHAAQLASVQQSAQKIVELERIIGELRQRCEALQAEKARVQQRAERISANGSGVASDALVRQRDVLLTRIRKQRHRTWAFREAQKRLESGWNDVAKQRETLKAKSTSLEQVKRLLEKQELVMARKLADHSALKTVAAVGIFVIMILGITFAGVYQFMSPTYRSEAIVTLPAGTTSEADMNKLVHSDNVVNTAWERLANDGYNLQAERDAFAKTLQTDLQLHVTPAAKQLSITYTGGSSSGVAQVANALANSYARTLAGPLDPGLSATQEALKLKPFIARVAVAPNLPIADTRFNTALIISASALFVSLIVVMLMRVYIYRQLREIDRMADEEDLDNLKGDLPLDAQPA